MLAPLLRPVDSELKLGIIHKYLPCVCPADRYQATPTHPYSSFLPCSARASELVVARRPVWEPRHLNPSGQPNSPSQAHSGQRTVPSTGVAQRILVFTWKFPSLFTEDPTAFIGETEAAPWDSNYVPPGSISTLPLSPGSSRSP